MRLTAVINEGPSVQTDSSFRDFFSLICWCVAIQDSHIQLIPFGTGLGAAAAKPRWELLTQTAQFITRCTRARTYLVGESFPATFP